MKWAIIQWTYLTKKQKETGNVPTKFPLALRVQGLKVPKYSWLKLPPLAPMYWDATAQKVLSNCPEFVFYDIKVSTAKNKITRLLTEASLNDHEYSAEGLIRAFEGDEDVKCFFVHADVFTNSLNLASSRLSFQFTVKKFKEWINRNTLYFDEITPELMNKYHAYLSRSITLRGRPMAKNTIQHYINKLKIIMNASPKGEAIIISKNNPFKKINLSIQSGEREPLTLAEVKQYERFPLEENSPEWHGRNFWLFSFYCQGIRWADMATMQKHALIQGDGVRFVKYVQQKSGTAMYVELLPKAEKILSYYKDNKLWLFSILNEVDYKDYLNVHDKEAQERLYLHIQVANNNVNKWIKRGRIKAGITKHITMHVTRHSVAEVLEGEDTRIISGALGHADEGVTKKHYMQKTKSVAINDKFRKALGED